MAAAAAVAAQQPVSPQVVGNAFVQQYYHILHHSPELVFRFYQDTSKLGRPGDDGNMTITTTMEAINEKILSLNYADFRAEIRSVDAQESFNGGVQVLVTGYLTGKDNMIRNFSQSFFLAPQDRGYFVLNDIFRYIENGNQQDGNQGVANDVVAPVTPEQNPPPPPVQENHVSEQSTSSAEEINGGEVYNPPENVDIPIADEEVPVAEVVNEVQDDSQMVVESNAKIEEVPKKSYASIVRLLIGKFTQILSKLMEDSQMVVESNAKIEAVPRKSYASIVMDHYKENAVTFSSPTPAPRKSVPKSQEQVNPSSEQESAGLVLRSDVVVNENNQDGEADGYSIYIKGLPMNATVTLLENEFKKFGPIKNGGIQVRSNRQQGFCFGFVEFEVPSAVQKAIEASPIAIGGRQAIVEEKRSTNSRGNNRGRFQSGRGSGFRNEGVRGHGNYGGGRGYSRGDFSGRNEFNRGGNRGGSSNRGGDVYQRSDSNGGRMNRTGGGGIMDKTTKNVTPRVSATA